MNRTQRRAAMRAEKRRPRMAQQAEQMQLQIHHGVTATQVYLGFSKPIPNLLLTPEQCRSLIINLEASLEKLEQTLQVEAN